MYLIRRGLHVACRGFMECWINYHWVNTLNVDDDCLWTVRCLLDARSIDLPVSLVYTTNAGATGE